MNDVVEEPDSTLFEKVDKVGIGIKYEESSYEDVCDLFRLLEEKGVIYKR